MTTDDVDTISVEAPEPPRCANCGRHLRVRDQVDILLKNRAAIEREDDAKGPHEVRLQREDYVVVHKVCPTD